MTVEPKIPGAVIPRRVFTQPGDKADTAWATAHCGRAVLAAFVTLAYQRAEAIHEFVFWVGLQGG